MREQLNLAHAYKYWFIWSLCNETTKLSGHFIVQCPLWSRVMVTYISQVSLHIDLHMRDRYSE